MNQTDLIREFINGATSGDVGDAHIKGNKFYHFETPIIERKGKKFIRNISNYSDVTRFLQRKITPLLSNEEVIEVNKVQMGYTGSLEDFVKEKNK